MVDVQIVNSVPVHTRQLTKTLRDNDKLEAIRAGLDVNKAVWDSYHPALYRKTALIDGRVAAMWGVRGTPLGITGVPYLITGTEVQKVSPLRFAKIYIQEVQHMKKLFPVLENYVDAGYTGAVRMLLLAGFTLKGPVLLNDHLFFKFTMGNV